MRSIIPYLLLVNAVLIVGCANAPGGGTSTASTPAAATAPAPAPTPTEDPALWRAAEAAWLANHAQLTFPERFVKAGEAYFAPDGARIIFQAIEQPAAGAKAADHYSMFVADLGADASGRPALTRIERISPPGSANTCGWFEQSRPGVVLYASTITPPGASDAPGYQRGTGRYKWQFPPEMRVVEMALDAAPAVAAGQAQPTVLVGDGTAYAAECSTTRDGRSLLYCSLASAQGDILVRDIAGGSSVTLVGAPGYDGGPFFSPDEKRICYRSDRNGDSLLQVQVSDLVRDASGRITGAANERQLTDNEHVNWAPFWHPTGAMIVYASSEMGHSNYEVFAVTTDPSRPPQRMRVTHAAGADVLPAFDADGKRLMWTSQRGEGRSSQLWIADFVHPVSP